MSPARFQAAVLVASATVETLGPDIEGIGELVVDAVLVP